MKKSCRFCKGKGWVGIRRPDITIPGLVMRQCHTCRGSGVVDKQKFDSYYAAGGKL